MSHAQVGGSMSLVSDYRFRGLSLSDGRSVPQLSLAYDSPRNWYAGAFASPVVVKDGRRHAQLLAYTGYTSPLGSGLNGEAGVLRTAFPGVSDYAYTEVYVGVSAERFSGRLYFSPDYYSQGVRTLYAEANGSYPLLSWLQLVGHAGYLSAPSGDVARMPKRWDARLGIAAQVEAWNFQVAATATRRERRTVLSPYGYAATDAAESFRPDDGPALVVSISRAF